MRCEDARRELLGAPPAPDRAALAAHLSSCESCAALQAQRFSLDALLDRHEPPTPRPGFDTRFFARLEEERKRTARSRWLRWSWALVPAAAAAALATFHAPPAAEPELPPEELGLVMDLPLVEELPLLQQLDEVEAFEALGELDDAELEQVLAEVAP